VLRQLEAVPGSTISKVELKVAIQKVQEENEV